jgi:dTDP-4-amino-4,6-dideoxygalactose transaminase
MAAAVPFVDIGRSHGPLKSAFLEVLGRALETSGFVMGAAVRDFEFAFAAYCGAAHCVGVASGTDALVLSLRAAGVGPGDEVITVPNTFIATAAAVRLAGATPVFVDPDEATQLMDPAALDAAVTARTKAVIPVHLFGQPVDMDPVIELARRHGLAVIEDACQAHGARYKGRRIGGLGSLGAAFSFYPGKNLGSLGEGGAVVTDHRDLADRLRRIRDHGSSEKYRHVELGTNSRLHAIQAAFLSIKLERLDEWNAERRRLAARYDERLAGVRGVATPAVAPWAEHVFHLYVVRVPDRDGAQAFLKERGIATGIHYPVPIHLQGAFADLGLGRGAYPVAERLADEILSLPMFPGLTEDEVDRVCDALSEWAAAVDRND